MSINALFVLAGCMMLGMASSVIGCFALLRRRALLGDALAHAALPGVCLAFMLTGSKQPAIILAGAMLSCWLGALAIDFIVRVTRVKEDSALGIVLSVFFGVGILLLTHIQKSGAAAQAGLDKFLFGQAAALVDRDLWVLGAMSVLMLGAVALAYKEFKLISFDPDFASAIGLPVHFLGIAMATLIVMAVAIGLQAVGVVLMAAMLVTPPSAARYWTDRLGLMIVLSGIFGAASGALGTWVSYISPNMPTGPWMVVGASGIFFISLLAAPNRGVIPRLIRSMRIRRTTLKENVLRTLYRLGEAAADWRQPQPTGEILRYRTLTPSALARTLSALRTEGLISETPEGLYLLTESGLERASRLTRLHRLWELYLTRRLELAPDHVHDDAEEIEHILTPDLEARLVSALDSPAEDPHARRIPGAVIATGEERS